MEQLGPRALYADTDSVVYTSRSGEWKPELGDYLGDLTDEVPDNRIIDVKFRFYQAFSEVHVQFKYYQVFSGIHINFKANI